jgi:hypothetical protein
VERAAVLARAVCAPSDEVDVVVVVTGESLLPARWWWCLRSCIVGVQ